MITTEKQTIHNRLPRPSSLPLTEYTIVDPEIRQPERKSMSIIYHDVYGGPELVATHSITRWIPVDPGTQHAEAWHTAGSKYITAPSQDVFQQLLI